MEVMNANRIRSVFCSISLFLICAQEKGDMHTTPNQAFLAETQGRCADTIVATSPLPVVSAGSAIMILFLALAASTIAAYHPARFDSHAGITHGMRFTS
jgi:hypothetical protein